VTAVSSIVSIDARSYFWRYSIDSLPNELLELKARFDQWRANRKYQSEPIPDELRSAGLEMTKRFSSSLLLKVLKVQVWHLKKRGGTKRSVRAASPKSSKAAFFKLPQPLTQAPAESLTSQTSTA
jgi:hypothetical protein